MLTESPAGRLIPKESDIRRKTILETILHGMDDRVKAIAPTYPYRNRQLHHEGKGWFQLTLDLRTGYVSKVAVVKSTGFKALDESAVAAFLKVAV